jgi:phosphoribosylanthranilate isomerase
LQTTLVSRIQVVYVQRMWIKICGVNDPGTAGEIAALRPNAVGLNFYEGSVRRVSPETAKRIADHIPRKIEVIGVYVQPAADFVRQTAVACGLSGIQIHSAGQHDAFADLDNAFPQSDRAASSSNWIKRIRGFQFGSRGLSDLASYLAEARRRGSAIDACLIDAYVEGQYGGTGEQAPWGHLRDEYQKEWPPLVLAGGLRPENVAEAIATVRPWGVDVSSGVESSPGVKDVDLVARFIDEARAAFKELEQN